jgi:hypothetical protein
MKCPSCGYENSDEARYCGLCQKPFTSFAREPSAPYGLPLSLKPKKEAVQAAQQVLKSQAAGPNWFQRHLNWTWVFAQLTVGLITYVLVTVFVTSLFVSSSTFPSEASLFASVSVMQVIAAVLQIASVFGVGGWVLKRKDRSLAWLLIFLVPFGWIIFLCLENRSDLVVMPVSPVSPVSPGPSGLSGSPESSSSIQPGLAPQGLGSQYGKYGP